MSENDLFDRIDEDIPMLNDVAEIGDLSQNLSSSSDSQDPLEPPSISPPSSANRDLDNMDFNSLSSYSDEELTATVGRIVEQRVQLLADKMTDAITKDIVQLIKDKN